MAEIRVRPATLDDLPDLARLYNHYVLHSIATFEVEPLDPAAWVPRFHEHNHGPYRFWVAAPDGGPVVGYAHTGRFRPRPAYDTTVEVSVYLAPDSQRTGLGRRLYRALFDSIAGEDLHRAVAVIALPNEPSVAFHRWWGFREVGRLPEVGRKFDRFWDVGLFARPLERGQPAQPSPEG